MYVWIWRRLPGPLAARLAVSLLLVAAVTVVLFTAVFPWVEQVLSLFENTVAAAGSAEATTAGEPGW